MVQDVERDEVEFISKTLGCTPVAHPDSLAADKLGTAGLVEDISVSGNPHAPNFFTMLARATQLTPRLFRPQAG